MKRKNHKYYRTRVVTLIFMFVNHKRVFMTSQCPALNHHLINSVIKTLATLLRWIFMLRVIKAERLWKTKYREL